MSDYYFYDRNPAFASHVMLFCPDGRRITYQEGWEYGDAILGQVPEGSLVFIMSRNAPASVTAYLACLRKRCVPLLLQGDLAAERLEVLVRTYHPGFVLMPGEKNTFTDYYWVRYMDFSLSDDRMVYTPDNPLYYGYVNVVETVEGYDPYGIIYEPLCVSNAVSMTVRFPRGMRTSSVRFSVAPTTRSRISADRALMRAMLLLMALISPSPFFSKETKDSPSYSPFAMMSAITELTSAVTMSLASETAIRQEMFFRNMAAPLRKRQSPIKNISAVKLSLCVFFTLAGPVV